MLLHLMYPLQNFICIYPHKCDSVHSLTLLGSIDTQLTYINDILLLSSSCMIQVL